MDVGAVLVREIKLHSDLPPLPEHPSNLTGQDGTHGLPVIIQRLESETLAGVAGEVRRLKTRNFQLPSPPPHSNGIL